ncbi:hypothetical protein HDV03_005127 [Kappamyces sp. JEL0829]|nr:hypothetical protein HDV03_005127 [Kappamyces sp. JEL0829]
MASVRRIFDSDEEDSAQPALPSSTNLSQELFGDSDQDDGPAAEAVDDRDLFGDDEDDAAEPAAAPVSDHDHDLFGEEAGDGYDYGGYDEQPAEKPAVTVEALLPDTQGPKDSSNLFLLKIPNFLAIEHNVFDHDSYRASREEDNEDELILMENTIRWRYSQQTQVPESNARIVRWSNGTFSLLVGGEYFDVQTTNITDRYQFLTTQFPQDGFLKTQARFRQFMSFTPHSTNSLAHKNLIAQLAKRHQKINKTKQYVVFEDPQQQAREAEKAHNEIMKQRRKLEQKRQQELMREGGYGEERADRFSTRYRGSAYQGLDEYEQDGFIDQDEELEEYGAFGSESDEEAQSSRLLEAKRQDKRPAAASEPAQKSKRLRIIEDSDSD